MPALLPVHGIGAQGFWWCSRSHRVHAVSCSGLNPSSSPGFCLGNICLAAKILMSSGDIAQCQEDALEGGPWHFGHVLRDTQTRCPCTSSDAKRDSTCCRLTQARDEPRRVTPVKNVRWLQALGAALPMEIVLWFLPLSLPIISSPKSCLELELGESHRNKRNMHRSGKSGNLEILPAWLSKEHKGGGRSRDRFWHWEPNLGSGEVLGQGPLQWSPGDAVSLQVGLRVGGCREPALGFSAWGLTPLLPQAEKMAQGKEGACPWEDPARRVSPCAPPATLPLPWEPYSAAGAPQEAPSPQPPLCSALPVRGVLVAGKGRDGEDGGAERQETEHKPGWGARGYPGGGVPRQGELEEGCPGELPRNGVMRGTCAGGRW